jgi:hypothetical protein
MLRDSVAEKKLIELQKQYGIQTCIETGTYLCEGAIRLSTIFPQVITIEINKEFKPTIELNLKSAGFDAPVISDFGNTWKKGDRSIVTVEGNSVERLAWIFKNITLPKPLCIALDAHWTSYWPILDEIKEIATAGLSDSIIVIHDFFVPGKGWNYDAYNGNRLDLEYVRDHLLKVNPNYKFVYNEEVEIKPEFKNKAPAPGKPDERVSVGILYVLP